jgi:hypothetical protein
MYREVLITMVQNRQRFCLKTLAITFAVILMCHVCGPSLLAEDAACCSVVHHALSAVDQIKPGMKRKEVEKFFVEDGGISFRDEGTYVFRSCQYIKVKIKFSRAVIATSNNFSDDTVTEVSAPYIQAPMRD